MIQPDKPAKRIYTFRVQCSFELQYSFSEAEVERDPGGNEEDFSPKDEAISALEKALRQVLEATYCITSLEAHTESDELIGIAPG